MPEVSSSTSRRDWVAGTPWRDLRLGSAGPEDGVMLLTGSGVIALGREALYSLSDTSDAAFLLPVTSLPKERPPQVGERLDTGYTWIGGLPFLRVSCLDRDLEPVFLRFCDSILDELEDGSQAADAFWDVLERYRALFAAARETAVLRETVMGLLGELVVLEFLLENSLDAIVAWRGPVPETHDFQFPNGHIEVKASSAAGEAKARISSLTQLSIPANGNLAIALVRFSPGGAETVATLSDRIVESLNLADKGRFLDLLNAAGCNDRHDAAWNAFSFSVSEIVYYKVTEGFPRIVPEVFTDTWTPSGLSEVKYTVSLNQAKGFIMEGSDLVEIIRGKENEGET